MATNAFLADAVYANTMLLAVKNRLVTGRLADGKFRDQVTDSNGLSISVKRPPRFKTKSGEALDESPVVTGSINLKVDNYEHVHIGIGDLESAQSWNALMHNQTLLSAASALATKIDSDLQDALLGLSSWTGTPANNITDSDDVGEAHTRLVDLGVPTNDIYGTVMERDGQKIRSSLTASNIAGINRDALQRASIPIISEVDLFSTQQVPSLTTGTRTAAATTLVNGAAQNTHYRDVKDTNSQTLNVDGEVGATYAKGEVFTIAGVYAYDWRKGVALDFLQQFTVLAAATGDASTGAAALTISPPIIVPGSADDTGDTETDTVFASVAAAPADNAAITFMGAPSTTFRLRSMWQKSALAFVTARLRPPETGHFSYATDPATGISIRYWRGSDISSGKHIHRWDLIYGVGITDSTFGTRFNGLS